ncbi:MAG TPA: hypothetical protein VI621_07410, partial [Flavobacterium sp.]|nr:hypothetical protein [Flavobacterium sp.]
HLFPPSDSGWIPQVTTCSSVTRKGIDKLWEIIQSNFNHTKTNGFFEQRRHEQTKYWMYETINESLKNSFYHHPEIMKVIPEIESHLLENKISSFAAANYLLELYKKK